mmetsp:Transcript_38532/g.110615  ORF Transcript_38532/g.110615 Transcript_38532/m.110615 type:complete len:491 (-) Transcript_38532:197-1669(-)|eukprot:CAMPEP_0176041398 /NCGR_PEP_ID=MMETSP0120_2-20121206/20533_1 /TAXON_ID=160619 /ORGANISM="Kryptoperidinium foliaceum, Strain CCMP 1326" /LENGTH=490 /DNA_ID=CAMNT_0017374799 /DNA_START=86 /DNA_END=1558 /DNA_ORIENTATION=-
MGRGLVAKGILARLLPWFKYGGQDYTYHGIVPHYCNVDMDWGALPPRPAGAQELLQVQVFVRHGARTQEGSDTCWDGDEVGHFSCSPQGGDASHVESGACPGQLAASGYEQEVNNGKRLREAYVLREGLVPSEFGRAGDAIVVRSTDKERTRQSAVAVMSGMFDDFSSGGFPFDAGLGFLETRSMQEENMVMNYGMCPASSWKAVAHFDRMPSRSARDMQAVCKRFAPKKEMTNKDCAWWLTHLMDCLMSRMCPTVPFTPRNATVPHEFFDNDDEVFRKVWQILDEVALGYFQEMVSTGAMSSLVGEILGFAERAVDGAHDAPKFLLYSGHDTGPMEPLSVAFGLREEPPYWPAFASMMALEVWHSDDGPVARWIVDGKVAAAGAMPFEDFHDRATEIKSYAPRCYDEELSAHAVALAPSWFKEGVPMLGSRAGAVPLALLAVVGLALLSVRARLVGARSARTVAARDSRAIELCSSADAAAPFSTNGQV